MENRSCLLDGTRHEYVERKENSDQRSQNGSRRRKQYSLGLVYDLI